MTKNAIILTTTNAHVSFVTVAVASIIKHYDATKQIDIIIVNDGMLLAKAKFIQLLTHYYNKPNIRILFYGKPDWTQYINQDKYVNYYPEVTFWRLTLPGSFSDYDKILYLDNDVLIYDDISPLFELFTGEKIIGAVRDEVIALTSFIKKDQIINFFTKETSDNANLSTINNFDYVNSGVLMFDVKKFNQHYDWQRLLNEINQRELGAFPDQNFINQFFENQIQHFDLKWNFQLRPYMPPEDWEQFPKAALDFKKEMEVEEQQTVIRHFTGHLKPIDIFPNQGKWDRDYLQLVNELKNISYTPYE